MNTRFLLSVLRVMACIFSLASIVSKTLDILAHPGANHTADAVQLLASIIAFVFFALNGSFRYAHLIASIIMVAGGYAGILRGDTPSTFYIILLAFGAIAFIFSVLDSLINTGQ